MGEFIELPKEGPGSRCEISLLSLVLSYKGPISLTTAVGRRNIRSTAFVEGRVVLAKTIFTQIEQMDFSERRSGHGRTGCYGSG